MEIIYPEVAVREVRKTWRKSQEQMRRTSLQIYRRKTTCPLREQACAHVKQACMCAVRLCPTHCLANFLTLCIYSTFGCSYLKSFCIHFVMLCLTRRHSTVSFHHSSWIQTYRPGRVVFYHHLCVVRISETVILVMTLTTHGNDKTH